MDDRICIYNVENDMLQLVAQRCPSHSMVLYIVNCDVSSVQSPLKSLDTVLVPLY